MTRPSLFFFFFFFFILFKNPRLHTRMRPPMRRRQVTLLLPTPITMHRSDRDRDRDRDRDLSTDSALLQRLWYKSRSQHRSSLVLQRLNGVRRALRIFQAKPSAASRNALRARAAALLVTTQAHLRTPPRAAFAPLSVIAIALAANVTPQPQPPSPPKRRTRLSQRQRRSRATRGLVPPPQPSSSSPSSAQPPASPASTPRATKPSAAALLLSQKPFDHDLDFDIGQPVSR